MKSLELDKNTAVYMVIPDTPLIEYPDYRSSYLNMVSIHLSYLNHLCEELVVCLLF